MAQPEIIQDDFAAGMFRSVARHLIPPNGAYDLVDLLLDDDGSVYKRGGTEYVSDTTYGAGVLRWLWEGTLVGGQRTLFVDSTNDDLGTLGSDEESPEDVYNAATVPTPVSAAQLGGVVFISLGLTGILAYAGSRKATYSTGTVTVTNGSTTVAGVGSSWSANVEAGGMLLVGSRYAVVESVQSNTSLTLTEAWGGSTTAGAAYSIGKTGVIEGAIATFKHIGSAGSRLFASAGNRLYMAPAENGPFGDWLELEDFHDLPGDILGLAESRGSLVVFTSAGTYALYNPGLELTDAGGNPQQRMELVSKELILLGEPGLASWQGGVVVPAVDGVWLLQSAGGAELVSRSIGPMYVDYVTAGYSVGVGAVHRSHYLLPVVDSSYVVHDVLVCRLDRPFQGRGGLHWPWTRLGGHAGGVTAFAERGATSGVAPELRGTAALRVIALPIFDPTAARKNDADSTTPAWELVTRDFTLNGEYEGLVRKVLLRYEMIDAASDNPLISGYYSTGIEQAEGSEWGDAEWGVDDWSDATLSEFTLLEGTAPEDDGRDPFPFVVVAKARFFKARFQSDDPAASMSVRSVRLLLDPMFNQR